MAREWGAVGTVCWTAAGDTDQGRGLCRGRWEQYCGGPPLGGPAVALLAIRLVPWRLCRETVEEGQQTELREGLVQRV